MWELVEDLNSPLIGISDLWLVKKRWIEVQLKAYYYALMKTSKSTTRDLWAHWLTRVLYCSLYSNKSASFYSFHHIRICSKSECLSVFMRLREYILSSPLILRQIGLRRQQTAKKNYPDQRWMCHAYVKCLIYLRSPICSLATIHGTRSNRHFIPVSIAFKSMKNQLQILDLLIIYVAQYLTPRGTQLDWWQ